MFPELSSQYWHHAYLVEGDIDQSLQHLQDFFSTADISTVGNPDFVMRRFVSLAIDDARWLKEAQSTRAVAGNKRIFVISFDFITPEAQNSLLKILEEPTDATHFFVVVSSESLLLPTVRSRMMKLSNVRVKTEQGIDVAVFLKMNYAKRLAVINPIVAAKDKAAASHFLDDLEKHFASDLNSTSATALEEIIKAKKYLALTGASLKMLLEHVSLIV